MNVREAALKALYEIEYNGAYSNIAVKEALKSGGVSDKDKPLFTALVYGTVDKKITLDYYIGAFSKIKPKKISKYIMLILRMGIYQLKFTDKIPESAAVNESVKLAKRYGHGASAGFVNGVLRNAARCGEIVYPKAEDEYLSVKYSYPTALCRKWIDEFGFEFADNMMNAFCESKKITLRANSLKTCKEELQKKLSETGIKSEIQDAAVVTDGFDIENSPLYRDGYFTPQDTAAMCTAEMLAPKPGEKIIDMCAAPGGKTTHIAEIMKNDGEVLAFDIYPHKTELIKKNAARLGISIIKSEVRNAAEFDGALKNFADRVLCDVPCSGLGIIGRKPDIKYSTERTEELLPIQRKILENAAEYVRDGGVIVYSTCTVEKAENEGVTGDFLKNHGKFEKMYEKTFYPHIDGTDGFYICKMRKND